MAPVEVVVTIDPRDPRVSEAFFAIDYLTIVDFAQDADSFGWAILALFTVNKASEKTSPRWGVLDVLTGTENGAEHRHDEADGQIVGYVDGTREDAIRRHWHLVDWHPSEAAARAAFAEARSRRW